MRDASNLYFHLRSFERRLRSVLELSDPVYCIQLRRIFADVRIDPNISAILSSGVGSNEVDEFPPRELSAEDTVCSARLSGICKCGESRSGISWSAQALRSGFLMHFIHSGHNISLVLTRSYGQEDIGSSVCNVRLQELTLLLRDSRRIIVVQSTIQEIAMR